MRLGSIWRTFAGPSPVVRLFLLLPRFWFVGSKWVRFVITTVLMQREGLGYLQFSRRRADP